MTRKAGLWAILPDMHAPYIHDRHAIGAVREFLRAAQPNVVDSGDGLECAAFSMHGMEDLDLDQWTDEADAGRRFYAELRGDVGDRATFVKMEGNHETRPARWALRNAPQLLGEVDIPKRLGFADLGIKWVPEDEQPWPLGDLVVIHGHQELRGRYIPQRHAHRMAMRYGRVIYGHTHRPNVEGFPYYDHAGREGRLAVAWGLGCLRSLHPRFMGGAARAEGWAHQFAVVEVSKAGRSSVYPVDIRDGRFTFQGQEFGVRRRKAAAAT